MHKSLAKVLQFSERAWACEAKTSAQTPHKRSASSNQHIRHGQTTLCQWSSERTEVQLESENAGNMPVAGALCKKLSASLVNSRANAQHWQAQYTSQKSVKWAFQSTLSPSLHSCSKHKHMDNYWYLHLHQSKQKQLAGTPVSYYDYC